MVRKISEMPVSDYMDLSALWKLETLLTKNVHVLRLKLPSRKNLVEEIKGEIKRLERRENGSK